MKKIVQLGYLFTDKISNMTVTFCLKKPVVAHTFAFLHLKIFELWNYLSNRGFFADLCDFYFYVVVGLGFWHHYSVTADF